MADHDSDTNPDTRDEASSNPASPSPSPSPSPLDDSSDASTPLDVPSADSLEAIATVNVNTAPADATRRVPSLRTVSDPQHTTWKGASSISGTLNNARRPPPSAGNLPVDIMQKARALQQQRMGMAARPGLSQASATSHTGVSSPPAGGGMAMAMNMNMHMNMNMNMGGMMAGGAMGSATGSAMGNMRVPPGLHRPGPQPFPRSAPVVPSAIKKPSLGERRAMKLAAFGPGSPGPAPTPKLSDMDAGGHDEQPSINGEGRGSKLSDFKNYVDADKGWITFQGAATITRQGVDFASGQRFSISLDEIDVLDELGKGNYGTVYKVRHARPSAPRFGQGLSNFKTPSRHSSTGAAAAAKDAAETACPKPAKDTSGVVMAMKEIRLELDESKFTTILKELVILHECVSPYIIDFYGAFFQEGAVYMCIEYMDGGSIDKLYQGGIPEKVLRRMTYATIMGLKSLKDDHNIIHRDVKPTNILVNTRGQVKICDFGVSGNLVASIAKTNIGCQSYMAPERISGGGMSAAGGAGGTYSVQSDIWSLGLTVIECAMGKYPYPPEVSSTIFSQLSAIVEGDPPDLPVDGYSDTARDFVKSCLNKVPAKRHTYPMLLQHAWMKSLGQPETITEDVEAEEAAADGSLADAAGGLSIHATACDKDVAAWVNGVLDRRRTGLLGDEAKKPALHSVAMNTVSPVHGGAAS